MLHLSVRKLTCVGHFCAFQTFKKFYIYVNKIFLNNFVSMYYFTHNGFYCVFICKYKFCFGVLRQNFSIPGYPELTFKGMCHHHWLI